MDKDGKVNYRRYANTLDYSLDQIKLREVYEKVYRRINFSFYGRKKEYTSRVINVTFKYSVAEFNKAGRNRYIRFGYKDSDLNFNDCVAIKDGELVGIILGQPVEYPVSDEVLGKYFSFEGGVYTLIKTPNTLKSTAELRRSQYPGAVDVWKRNFNHVEQLFDYGSAVRKVMYTTNAVESINSSFRKVTKKGAFPNENALLKLLYLRITELYKKWNGSKVQNWAMVRNQLATNDKIKARIEKYEHLI